MTAAGHSSRDQARLWLIAFVVSAALNGLVLIAFGLNLLAHLEFMPSPRRADDMARGIKPQETVAWIVPEIAAVVPAAEESAAKPAPPPPATPSFARTSRDQESPAPENPAFIGERNTRATSDLAAEPEAPAMPNQEGEEPDDEGDLETTVSRLQDGDLATDRIARPDAKALPEMATGPDAPEPMRTEAAVAPPPAPPPAQAKETEKLAQGPISVEREEKADPEEQAARPPEPAEPARNTPQQATGESKELPKEPTEQETADKEQPGKDTPPTRPAPSVRQADPGFRGYQYKHRIHGSINRQGRSALDVEDSVLGRYHAQLSRAVEREWQRNCVRNRDYITPGQIIVRFVLEANGKVRSVSFVEEFGVGNIQKGFTSESIRTAAIPPFPAEMKKQLDGEPLEVTYSFTF